MSERNFGSLEELRGGESRDMEDWRFTLSIWKTYKQILVKSSDKWIIASSFKMSNDPNVQNDCWDGSSFLNPCFQLLHILPLEVKFFH